MIINIIATLMMVLFISDIEAIKIKKSIRNKIQKQLQNYDSDYSWIGTSPWCKGSCKDCYDDEKSCYYISGRSDFIPIMFQNIADFGSGCWSGKKALCGPKNEKSIYFWYGGGPECFGLCNICIENGFDCLSSISKKDEIEIEYQNKADFGEYDCISGYKVLCGPHIDRSNYYWIGTAPLCQGSCDDCYNQGANCLIEASYGDFVPLKYKIYGDLFGKACITGKKALCQKI